MEKGVGPTQGRRGRRSATSVRVGVQEARLSPGPWGRRAVSTAPLGGSPPAVATGPGNTWAGPGNTWAAGRWLTEAKGHADGCCSAEMPPGGAADSHTPSRPQGAAGRVLPLDGRQRLGSQATCPCPFWAWGVPDAALLEAGPGCFALDLRSVTDTANPGATGLKPWLPGPSGSSSQGGRRPATST